MGFGNEQKGVPGALGDSGNYEHPKRVEHLDYGRRHDWYGESTNDVNPYDIRQAWLNADDNFRASYNNNYQAYYDNQVRFLSREAAGLGDDDTYNKAIELHKMSIRGHDGPQSEWEIKLRDAYRDSTNNMYSRAQASGRNRAAVARAYGSGIQQQDAVMEKKIQAMRGEESKIAGDALTNLLYQARTAGAEGAAASAELLQQWQHGQDQAQMDLIANVIGGLSTLAGAVIL